MPTVAQTTDSEGKENYIYFNSGLYKPEWAVVKTDSNEAELKVYLQNETEDFNAFMLDIFLPEGFSIAKNTRGNSYKITFNRDGDDTKTWDHVATVGDNSDYGYFRILGYSSTQTTILPSNPDKPEADWLMTITLSAPSDFSSNGSVTDVSVKNIEFSSVSNTVSPHYFPDTHFTLLNEAQLSGVEDVIVDEKGKFGYDGSYDLYGRKVDGALVPGIYIVNGRKVLVK